MNHKERLTIAAVLGLVAIMIGFDLGSDAREGATKAHLLFEAVAAVLALSGVFFILRGQMNLKQRLAKEKIDFAHFKLETEEWKADSRKFVDGLSTAIDQQLSKWSLTSAEKEVAFLLLKGMSLKEIAETRKTAEKTARAQSMAVYAKSGLTGRSELSAFFLEDLLLPNNQPQQQKCSI